MSAHLRIARSTLAVLAVCLAASPAGASPWNTLTPVTGAQTQQPSESGTEGFREDEPDAGRQGGRDDPRGDGAGERPRRPRKISAVRSAIRTVSK